MRFLLLLAGLTPLVFSEEDTPIGEAFRSSYIIGGKNAEIGSWPWQASLQKFGMHFCGASLISARWLVTASHCVGSSEMFYSIIMGMHDMDRKSGVPEEYHISRIIRHPKYSTSIGHPNDIAVIKLERDVKIDNKYVSTITMASTGDSYEGHPNCYITGWGGTQAGAPAVLQEAQVEVYSLSYCQGMWSRSMVKEYHVCVGTITRGSCNGDSGGPLVCPRGDGWVLVGSSSWGEPECGLTLPSIYTSIAYYRDWIQTTTGV